MMYQEPISVYELTSRIKELLETSFDFVLVVGEISNYKRHTSGHVYFTLKDDKSQINCTLWKYKAGSVKFQLENGLKVIILGKVSVYEKGGNYQLNVNSVEPAGLGELQLAFEQLKKKLDNEGLFGREHKKPIPAFPERVGVVTSKTGAAIRDIINIIKRRQPSVEVILRPVNVQGEGASRDIAEAIAEFNEFGKVDVLIVGRGGGSLEDLWAFNEEVTARAIFESKIPVISAVGHEIDFTISDFTADLRAPTPSAAAELAVKDVNELRVFVNQLLSRLISSMVNRVRLLKDKLTKLRQSAVFDKPLDIIRQHYQYIDNLTSMMNTHFNYKISTLKQRVSSLERQLNTLDPKNILSRGYSITRMKDTENVVTSPKDINPGDKLETILREGNIISVAE